MADNTLTSAASILYEMQAKVQEQFATEHVFLAELNGVGTDGKVGRFTRDMDMNRDVFSGSKVRIPLIPYGMQGGGYVSETGTWNVPHTLDIDQAEVTLGRTIVPLTVTIDLERDSMSNSAIQATALAVKQARQALAKVENIGALWGDNTIAAITDSATSLTTTVATTSPWDILLPGTVWDILTRSNGADPGQGLRRLISSVNESTGVITWSTTQQASDGGSGNITHSSNEGIYLPGSYGQVVQGLEEASATSGTFEGLDKGTYAYWKGTDGRGGTTTSLPLSDAILEEGVRRARRYGKGAWSFGIGDPAVIDLYKQGKYSQVQYAPQESTLKSGFRGIVFDGGDQPFPLIKEPHHKKGKLHFFDREDVQVYGDAVGPKFLDDDGSMWRRFSRSLPKEADLLDRWQVGYMACNRLVFFDNLAS